MIKIFKQVLTLSLKITVLFDINFDKVYFMIFVGKMVLCQKINFAMKEMVSETGVNPNKGTFGTSISFDIDEAPKPIRRKGRDKNNQLETDSTKPGEISNCPGCGADINHDCLTASDRLTHSR